MTPSQIPRHGGQIALGTMYFGTRQGERESFAILERFLEHGGRSLDTEDHAMLEESA